MLSYLQPPQQVISTDNVNPLAILQVEALGACFHLNEDLAPQFLNLLVHRGSSRIERLSQSIGSRPGDTTSLMSQRAGGRALSLAFV